MPFGRSVIGGRKPKGRHDGHCTDYASTKRHDFVPQSSAAKAVLARGLNTFAPDYTVCGGVRKGALPPLPEALPISAGATAPATRSRRRHHMETPGRRGRGARFV